MDRKDFLKNTALISLGGLLLPPFLLNSCAKESLFEEINWDGKVLILGAGAAGLYAAYLLKSKGISFEILEASSVHGGRLGKLTGFADYPLDLGAQWLHGVNSLVGDLVKKSQTPVSLDDSAEKIWFNNQIVDSAPIDVVAAFEAEGLPDVSYKQYAIDQGWGSEYDNLVEAIAGDSGAAASRISAYYKIVEEETWASGDDDYKFQGTFFDLIDQQVAAHVQNEIRLNTVVTKIDYSQNNIVVTDSNNNTYTADKIILTVPITVLKSNDIQFVPALSADKTEAFSKIGMDAGMKVFLKFSSKFYDGNIAGGSICAAYADESTGKSGSENVLLAFIMGEQAEHLNSLGSDAAIVSALLQELDTMYNGQASATYLDAHVENWTNHPYIRGAYSYSTVGIGDARKTAAQSVDDKLFFAGEAMNVSGHHQTVHGAVETGYREVINLIDSLGL